MHVRTWKRIVRRDEVDGQAGALAKDVAQESCIQDYASQSRASQNGKYKQVVRLQLLESKADSTVSLESGYIT